MNSLNKIIIIVSSILSITSLVIFLVSLNILGLQKYRAEATENVGLLVLNDFNNISLLHTIERQYKTPSSIIKQNKINEYKNFDVLIESADEINIPLSANILDNNVIYNKKLYLNKFNLKQILSPTSMLNLNFNQERRLMKMIS